jgi:hypothetical protein
MSRRAQLTLCVLGLLAACGCARDGGDKLFPVRGQVTVGGKPLPRGAVSFRPLPDRGNTTLHHPTAELDESGSYTLQTGNRGGAPAGWYKVLVSAQAPSDGPTRTGLPAAAKSLINKKYSTLATTDLIVEVVAEPAERAYDLKVEK